jgi:hypothetical protein
MAKRNAKVELTLDKDRFDRGLDAAGRRIRKFARDGRYALGDLDKSTGEMMAGGLRKFGGKALRGAAAGAAGVAAAGIGILGVAAAATFDDVMKLEKGMTRYQIATDATDAEMATFRTQLGENARASGMNRQELLDGAAAYVALTGDAGGAAKGMALFAKVSNATGASMADVSATAAAMKDNLGIDPADFEAAFSALHVQGKAGAVELRELATELAGVAPSFAKFKNGGGTAGLAEMGAALQVVRKGFGSTSEAATGFRSLLVAVQRNAKKFQAAGVRIYDKDPKTGKKTLRDFSDIVDAIGKSKLAKDPTLLTKAFGADEAKRAYDQLSTNRALLDELIQKSQDKNAIDRDAATYLASPAARVSKAWEAAKQKLAEVFTPERIAKFAAALEAVVVTMGNVIDAMERAKQIMDGNDSNLLGPDLLGKIEGIRAQFATPDGPSFALPDIGNWKTRNPGTTTSAPVISQWEGIGRDAIGRSRDYNLGGLLGFVTAAEQSTSVAATTRPARLTPQGPMAAGWSMDRGSVPIVIQLQVDGNQVAKAAANAPVHRSRPGGR